MKFLLDANVRSSVGCTLQQSGYDVRFLAGTSDHQLPDHEVVRLAVAESRILVTNDKDFGQLIFQQKLRHHGVILFRLSQETKEAYTQRMRALINLYGNRLENHFIVVTDEHVRYR